MKKQFEQARQRELRSWPGVVEKRVEFGGKHMKVTLAFEGRERYVVFAGSCGDIRASLRHVQDVRRVCRELGAKRC